MWFLILVFAGIILAGSFANLIKGLLAKYLILVAGAILYSIHPALSVIYILVGFVLVFFVRDDVNEWVN